MDDNNEVRLLILTLVGTIIGLAAVALARTSRSPSRIVAGRCLFVANLLIMGASGLTAATQGADGLILLGLASGLLIVCMLWEIPHPVWSD